MKHQIFIIVLFFTTVSIDTYGQSIQANSCDSNILTKEEFKKCIADKAWDADIVITTNYITNLKTALLPKYRKLRKELILPNQLEHSLQHLKATYDTVLNARLTTFLHEMDNKQQFVQPKAYLSTLLSLQTFKIYPDIYAILLNDIHLQLSPKTTASNLTIYKELVDKLSQSIPPDLYTRLEIITTTFCADNDKLRLSGFSPLFQGIQSPEDTKKYQVINFLLWTD